MSNSTSRRDGEGEGDGEVRARESARGELRTWIMAKVRARVKSMDLV